MADETRRDGVNTAIADFRRSIEERPEFMVNAMAIDGAGSSVAQDIREVVPIDFPVSSFDLDLEEIRATIAALACLLVLRRRGHYDELQSILVYPAAFWVEHEVEDEAGVVSRRRRVLSGEAWESSRIVLSWDDVLEAARAPGQGYNVALHEFAHYLDAEGLGPAAPRVRVLQLRQTPRAHAHGAPS